MVDAKVEAVPPVVFVGKPSAVVDTAVREAAFALGQCVRKPACRVSYGASTIASATAST